MDSILFEKQDKVLLGLNSGRDAAAALRILQQQGLCRADLYRRRKCSHPCRAAAPAGRARPPSWTVHSLPPATMPA